MKTSLALLLLAGSLAAHDPVKTPLTWSRDVAPLFTRHCVRCHGEGAQLRLTTYADAVAQASKIRAQVSSRLMPPWGAVRGFGPPLKGDPSLSSPQLDILLRWLDGGMPKGDSAPEQKLSVPLGGPNLSGASLLRIPCQWRTPDAVDLLGVRAYGTSAQEDLRITVTLPDGAQKPIIWLRDLPLRTAEYAFENPIPLPRDATVHAESATGPQIELVLSRGGAWLRKQETTIRKQTPACSTR